MNSQQAIVRDLQRHPATEKVMHIDFFRVRADQAIDVNLPIHFINEDRCTGVRLEGGVISHNLTDVEISCLPADLPEFIEVDIAELGVGEAIHLSDLVVPDGVTIVQLALGADHDISVVTVNEPRVSAVEEEEAEGEEQAPEAPEADEEEPGED